MVLQVEYMDHPFPNGLAMDGLADGDGLGERGAAAVLAFYRLSKLNLGHTDHAGDTSGVVFLRYAVLLVLVPGSCSIMPAATIRAKIPLI